MTRIRAALATLLLAAALTAAAAPPANAGNVEERISVRNQGGLQVTYWWAHKDTSSGPDEILPDRVDVCGVQAGQTVRATVLSYYGGTYYGPTSYATPGEGCTTITVAPTTWVKVGYAGANPRTQLTLTIVGGGSWSWPVTGSTGQLAPLQRPTLSDPPETQDFVAQP